MRVIAIDGPAGVGKSTVARRLAAHLGLEYLDTGAMYRGVAFAAIRRGIDPGDRDEVAAMVQDVAIEVSDQAVTVDGVDATVEIRSPEVSRASSVVATNPDVRRELQRRQRAWARDRGGGVIEGRDIGSVVFPDAELKLYLTASTEVRARRRALEVTQANYEQVMAQIAERDARDEGRAVDPAVVAGGATVVDTTDKGVDDVVAEIVGLLA